MHGYWLWVIEAGHRGLPPLWIWLKWIWWPSSGATDLVVWDATITPCASSHVYAFRWDARRQGGDDEVIL